MRKILKHSEYQDEMILLFEQGLNYTQIAEHLIEKYNLDITSTWFRTSVRYFIQNGLTDKEILKENVSLAKAKQRLQDKNRIQNKAFREDARIENAVAEYNKELIKVLKGNSFNLSKKKHKKINLKGTSLDVRKAEMAKMIDMVKRSQIRLVELGYLDPRLTAGVSKQLQKGLKGLDPIQELPMINMSKVDLQQDMLFHAIDKQLFDIRSNGF